MLTKTKVAGAVIALSVMASAADAYVIDFTSTRTGTSGTLFGGSVTWELFSDGVLDNSEAFDGTNAPSGTELAFETDGYGQTGPHSTPHRFGIEFSAPVLVDAFYFLDLFSESWNGSVEFAVVTVNHGERIFEFVGGEDWSLGASGFIGGEVDPILARHILFTTGGGVDGTSVADGAIAAIGIAPVPVPAAGTLLLAGLGGLAALRRRKKSA